MKSEDYNCSPDVRAQSVNYPLMFQDWSVRYATNEPVQPRFELNAPDLYIPTMAYLTYVLVAGLALGTQVTDASLIHVFFSRLKRRQLYFSYFI